MAKAKIFREKFVIKERTDVTKIDDMVCEWVSKVTEGWTVLEYSWVAEAFHNEAFSDRACTDDVFGHNIRCLAKCVKPEVEKYEYAIFDTIKHYKLVPPLENDRVVVESEMTAKLGRKGWDIYDVYQKLDKKGEYGHERYMFTVTVKCKRRLLEPEESVVSQVEHTHKGPFR